MIKNKTLYCDFCGTKGSYLFEEKMAICENCLNRNGIISISKEEKQILINCVTMIRNELHRKELVDGNDKDSNFEVEHVRKMEKLLESLENVKS